MILFVNIGYVNANFVVNNQYSNHTNHRIKFVEKMYQTAVTVLILNTRMYSFRNSMSWFVPINIV